MTSWKLGDLRANVWAAEKKESERQRIYRHQQMPLESKRYHLQRREEEEAKQELEQAKERKRYKRWYRRAWRAISNPRLPTAKVVKE